MMETRNASEIVTSKRETSGLGDAGGPTGAERAVHFRDTAVETGHGISPHREDRLQAPFRARGRMQRKGKAIESGLLRKAQELVDSMDPGESYDTQLYLPALRGTVAEMWESAPDCSELHEAVLATLENGVRQAAMAGSVTAGQLAAFREALNDLGQSALVQANAEVVRSEFVRQGFTALGFADKVGSAE